MDNLEKAIKLLVEQCDGARSQDNVGFNKLDAAFGHYLAKLPYSQWTDAQKKVAYNMLKKYAVQLKGLGIDFIELPVVPLIVSSTSNRTISLLDNKYFIIRFNYRPELVNAVKQLPGRKWHRTKKYWTVPWSNFNYNKIKEFAHINGFIIDKTVYEYIEEIETESKKEDIIVLDGRLYEFQKKGVRFALKTRRCFLADRMGLGKTVQALATIESGEFYPALVVCPASLKLNWEREASKWTTASISVINGKSNDFNKDIVIINYDILKKYNTEIESRKFKAVMFDESHYLKSPDAIRTRIAKSIVKNIDVRLMLTGTPILNRPKELIAQLDILGRLEEMGGAWSFLNRFCNPTFNGFGWVYGASNLKELHDRMTSSFMLVRTKEEVLKELPAKTKTVLPVTLSNLNEYKQAEKDLISWLKKKSIEDKGFLNSIENLSKKEQEEQKHIRASSETYKVQRAESLVRIEKLKQLTVEGKMSSIVEWVENFLESGEKLVLFGWHKDPVNQLAKKFNTVCITGETSLNKRQEYIDKFQTDDSCKLIVMNMQSGGLGITLTASSNVAFFELGWTPALHNQAEDRCHRIGQHDVVNAYYLVGRDSIDEEILELIEKKREIVDTIVDGKVEFSVLKELLEKLKQREI